MFNSMRRALVRVLGHRVCRPEGYETAPPTALPACETPAPRRWVLTRTAGDVRLWLRPAEGPFSQAAYDRWVRAESRWRRERYRALWAAGPSVFYGSGVRW